MLGFDRITFDPDLLGGKACIRGMRISVSLVVNLVADGMTAPQIVAEYPDLEEEDIAQALKYAALIGATLSKPSVVPRRARPSGTNSNSGTEPCIRETQCYEC